MNNLLKSHYLVIGILLFGFFACGQQSTKSNNEQTTDSVANEISVSDILPDTDTLTFNNAKAIKMLKEFYTEYDVFDSVFFYQDSVTNNEQWEKWEKKYITKNLKKQVEKTGIDLDFLIDGRFIVGNLNTLSISLDSIGTNNFCVKYALRGDKKGQGQVRFHIIKDGNNYKIDKVLR